MNLFLAELPRKRRSSSSSSSSASSREASPREVKTTPVKKVEQKGIAEYTDDFDTSDDSADEYDMSSDEEEYIFTDDIYLRKGNLNDSIQYNNRTEKLALSH